MTAPLRQTKYLIPDRVLVQARQFFQERGKQNLEGTALLIGVPHPTQKDCVKITRLFIPEQVAIRNELGCSVDLTQRAHFALPDELVGEERFHMRIHSHPEQAFHSRKDDSNAVITHQGAISIVVPYFARDRIVPSNCAIYRLEHGKGWGRLSNSQIEKLIEVK